MYEKYHTQTRKVNNHSTNTFFEERDLWNIQLNSKEESKKRPQKIG